MCLTINKQLKKDSELYKTILEQLDILEASYKISDEEFVEKYGADKETTKKEILEKYFNIKEQ